MLTEASIPTAHGSSHGLVPQVQYSEHFSSPDIHTHHHSAPSTIFTPGESLSTDPHLISGPGPSTVTQEEPIDEVMRPGKCAGPDSHSCFCILVWNSVKDYWEWFYGSLVYSITKLWIGMLLSIASPKSVRAQGRTFTSWSESFDDFVQYSSFLGCLCGSDASNLLIGASFTLAGL